MSGGNLLAWHFLHEGHLLRDGSKAPADGEWLRFEGKPILCDQGLHASVDPFAALRYAPGPILCRVECGGVIVLGDDKIVCTERRIVARMDATDMLRYYARMQAVSVAHLWEPPQLVLDYLMTGDEGLRAAAWSAAWSAARSSAGDAAWSAAWDAARKDFGALVAECFEGGA